MPPRTPSSPVAQLSWWSFFKAFLSDRQRIGAVAPTSAGVGRRMAQLGDIAHARNIVEFGAGTGPITAQILEALPADGRMWAFEIHEPFVEHLRSSITDPRFTVLAESAEHVRELRAREAPEGFDAIICSIPFSLLPPPVTSGILAAAAEALRPGGVFVALQYHPTYLRPIMREHFEHVTRTFYPWNVPPTLLLSGRGSRHSN